MPSFGDRSREPSSPTSGLGQSLPSTGPLPAGERLTIPLPSLARTTPQQADTTTVLVSQQLPMLAVETRPVPSITGALVGSDGPTTGVRTPVVIKGARKRSAPVAISYTTHKKRRFFFSLLGVCLLFLITTGTLLAATPLGREIGSKFTVAQFGSNLFSNPNSASPNLIAQATAIANYNRQYDGYVPPGGMITNGDGSLDWPSGQCTYWANLRYHQLTNFWVPWTGNADQWVSGARKAPGWNVSTAPHIPSIIVLLANVQNASGFGHVAVVERINDNGSVYTSNMNWFDNGGGLGIVSYVTFNPGPGVFFVWHS